MNSAERTVVDATRAYGNVVGDIRPLDLTPEPGARAARAARELRERQRRRARRLRSWLVPAAAAAAVLAIAVSLVIIRDIPNGRGAPQSAPAATSGVPPYYVAISGTQGWYAYAPLSAQLAPANSLVVGATFTGKRLATVMPPHGATFIGVTGAADDRTFIVETTQAFTPSSGPAAATPLTTRTWYLLRLRPGATPASTLTRLPIPVTASGTDIEGIAVSPDGTELSVYSLLNPDAGRGTQTLRIYSVPSGKVLRTWSATVAENPGYLALQGENSHTLIFWTDGGRELAFDYVWSTGAGAHRRFYRGVRLLDLASPGHDLLADSRLAWSQDLTSAIPFKVGPMSCELYAGLLVTADGAAAVCGATGMLRDPGTFHGVTYCPRIKPWIDEGFLEFTTATGKPLRTVYRLDTSCGGLSGGVGALWVSASGDQVVGYIAAFTQGGLTPNGRTRIGVFTSRGYRPLPLLPVGVNPDDVAW